MSQCFNKKMSSLKRQCPLMFCNNFLPFISPYLYWSFTAPSRWFFVLNILSLAYEHIIGKGFLFASNHCLFILKSISYIITSKHS